MNTEDKLNKIYSLKLAMLDLLRAKGYSDEVIGTMLNNIPNLIRQLDVVNIEDKYPDWFLNSLVCWYNPSKLKLTNEEIKDKKGTFILKDFSKNHLDMTMHNFAGEGMSGMGGYWSNCKQWLYGNTINIKDVNQTKLKIENTSTYSNLDILQNNVYNEDISLSVHTSVSNFQINVYFTKKDGSGVERVLRIESNGEHFIKFSKDAYTQIRISIRDIGIYTIEILPSYPDGLVFDGTDDYGISENLPILTDYTVMCKREWVDISSVDRTYLCGKRNSESFGAFMIEGLRKEKSYTLTFGYENEISLKESKIITQTKNSYNENTLKNGSILDTSILGIGRSGLIGVSSNIVLYSFLLFNRTLTPKEIDWVKYNIMNEKIIK